MEEDGVEEDGVEEDAVEEDAVEEDGVGVLLLPQFPLLVMIAARRSMIGNGSGTTP